MIEEKIILPKEYNGKPVLSYTQVSSFNTLDSYQYKYVPGWVEYIQKYFLNVKFPDIGYGQFGTEVENYICTKEGEELFSSKEKKVLNKIKPLGTFQQEGLLDFGDFHLILYIDDATSDFKHIRDYKTKSKNTIDELRGDDYVQMDIYSMWVKQEFGYYPDKVEIIGIERIGNAFTGGREGLKVGNEIWKFDREVTEDRCNKIRKEIIETANKISNLYKTYQKIFL